MIDQIDRLKVALADRYAIERELGAGGMATVYLARDLRHDRDVALKVLRPELSALLGSERFLQEIRVTAHLQHPHILHLYDSGDVAGLLFYVMPCVQGESLRARLERETQLPVDDAVRITREVASALDYAHGQGVIHRDIKPENILLEAGQAVVADFGIALAISAAAGSRLTETGLSLGTPSYMSPEQATGNRAIDRRSDIYSLGCVAYEMLAGAPPHTGPTNQAVIAKIVTETPPRLSLARPSVPPGVEAAIHKAIEKISADRFQKASEFADALSRPSEAVPVVSVGIVAAAARVRSSWRLDWRIAAVLAVAALAIGWLIAQLRSPVSVGPLQRFSVVVPRRSTTLSSSIALSPDGSVLAVSGVGPRGPQLFVRVMADSGVRAVEGTDNAAAPFFSTDSRWIGFWAGGRLLKVPVDGGVPSVIVDSAERFAIALEDGGVLYAGLQPGSLRLVRPDGGVRDVARVADGRFTRLTRLPGERSVLATVVSAGRLSVMAVSLRDGSLRPVDAQGAVAASYASSGHLVYQPSPGGPLLAARFDARRLRITGSGRTIAPPVQTNFLVYPQWDAAASGLVAYFGADRNRLELVRRDGRATPLLTQLRAYHHPRFSPDGRRIALDITEGNERDVWVLDVGDRTLTRLTVNEVANDALWSPDGRRVAYTSLRGAVRGIFLRNADGSGAADSVYADAHDRSSGSWTSDGSAIVSNTSGLFGLWVVPLARGGAARQVAGSRATEVEAAMSPDGRWLAYVSDESGRREVYVRPFPGPGGRFQVSTGGGTEPVWTRGGRELIYREYTGTGSRLVAASVRVAPDFHVLDRTLLFDASDLVDAPDHANFDVRPDGEMFVVIRQTPFDVVQLVQGWPHLLEGQEVRP